MDAKKVLAKSQRTITDYVFYPVRVLALIMTFMMFLPGANPVKMTALMNGNLSLFTSAVSWKNLISDVGRGFRSGWVMEGDFQLIMISAIIILVGIALCAATGCVTLGNHKLQFIGSFIGIAGGIAGLGGMFFTNFAYNNLLNAAKQDKIMAELPGVYVFYLVMFAVCLICSIVGLITVQKPGRDTKCEMDSKYKLFIMFLPFGMLAFVFSYLPLWGWRYAFFDYKAGQTLTMDAWVGTKWFTYLFQNEQTRRDILRVLKNTMAMSGLGILTSWLPMAFAIFLAEIKNSKFKRFVQTFTTIPNFVSWILVYTIAIAIFSTDGFINTLGHQLGTITDPQNYLMSAEHSWLKMLLWGTWKGIGWSAIVYIAGISGIDNQLYEAATVDGAGRFQKMWHVTLPGLVPTYCVLLLMSIANILSNGMEQYLVFSNAMTKNELEVLDLYVYNIGIGSGSIPLSTVVGMTKSLISVILLFGANGISKAIRGESIV